MSSRTRSRKQASIGSNHSLRRPTPISASEPRTGNFVLLLVMAWSPPAHNAGNVRVSAPGDYATFNSNHTPDGTGDDYGEGLRLELGGSWTGPDGVLITSCCFDVDGCGALVELSLGMGAGSLVRALRSRPTKALPIWRGTGSSNPPRSTSESDAKLLPRVWSCLVRSDEATQAVSPHSRIVQLPPSYSAARHQRRLAAKAKPIMPEPSNAELAGSGMAPTLLGSFYRPQQ